MLPVKEFTNGPAGFPSLINYFEFVDEGVLFNRDGSLLGCFYYCGPDMDSSLGPQEDQLCSQIQSIFQNFGNGWSVHVDLIRVPALDYPKENHFNNPTSLLIEKRLRERYQAQGDHFENIYAISFCYLPSVVENKFKSSPSLEFIIDVFNQKLGEFQGNISNKIRIKRMSCAEMMTFLNRCICGGKAETPVPQPPCYLNHYLGAHEFIGGHEPMIDDNHIGVITLTQFPYESYSGILNVLSNLPFEYRFSSRFLFYDPIDALGIINEYQGKYLGMKYSIGQMIMGAFGKDPRLNPDAANRSVLTKIEETKQAQQAVELGQVNYGYATFVVVVLDNDKAQGRRKIEFIRDLLNNNWFPSIIEKMNSIEAYLGSLPGDTLKNIRKPFINTQNLSNMLPLTDVWTGSQYNPCPYYPKNSPPLFYAATNGTTPFKFNVHVGDVGHTLILGPTGAGKSVLLSHIANSSLRYEGAQVYIFDKGYSQYVLTHAVGGVFYDIMGDDETLAFCPLSNLGDLASQKWACGWLERLIQLQGVVMNPAIRAAIEVAVRDTGKSPSRTLSDFYLNLQNDEIKEALKPFAQIKEGYMSSLLDAKEDGFKKGKFQTFEISNLMGLDNRLSTPVLLYLFHKIQCSLDGSPTFIIIDEGWLIMLHETFMTYWIEFLRTIRKNNACVLLATQSLSDIVNSPYASFINESCLTKIFLPNPAAREADNKTFYGAFGLNERQIEIISTAVGKKHYYVTARDAGHRLIDLGLKNLELAFYGAGTTPQEREKVKELKEKYGDHWPAGWLKYKGLISEAQEWLAISALIVVFMIFPFAAKAQDVATEHTQVLNNIELITENLRQLQSLENQIEMIKNQVEGLKSVANYQNNFSDVDALRNNLTNITNQGTALSNQTQGMLIQMQQLINNLPANGTMTDSQESLAQGALNIVQNTLNRVAQLRQSYQQVINSINALMDKNDQAVGQTQALQTSNQLAAQSIAQTQSTQELLSEQISMQAAMMSKQLQEEKDDDDKMKQIFNAADDGSSIFGPLN